MKKVILSALFVAGLGVAGFSQSTEKMEKEVTIVGKMQVSGSEHRYVVRDNKGHDHVTLPSQAIKAIGEHVPAEVTIKIVSEDDNATMTDGGEQMGVPYLTIEWESVIISDISK